MKRRLGTALLALALLQMLLPATALAAEADNIVDTSALEYFEIPLIDPRDPPAGTTGQLEYAPNADQAAGADHIVDASELEYFEIPLIDPRYPPANTLDNSENDPNSVQLADKRAVRCIDRLKLPQFARDFYNTLERESKPANLSGLGRDGVLIDPSQSSATQAFSDGNAYVIRFSFPSEYELRSSGFRFSDYLEYIKNCVGTAFNAFEWDHPEVFWTGGYGYYYDGNQRIFCIVLAYKGFPSDKSNWDIRVEGYRDPDVIKKNINALNQSVASIIRDAGRMSSNYEKITYFNEWLTTNNQYNYTIAYTNNSADRMIYTSLGALTTKDGSPGGGRIGCDGPVCTGYAKAFLLLCQNADIPCVLDTGANHAWNYVQVDPLDSRWYAVDVTWNDPILWGTPTAEEYASLGANSNMETTAYLLVGADTIVYAGKTETFLDQHPPESMVAGENYVHANFKMGPELNQLAYVDNVVIEDLDAPVKGAVPDTRITLSSAPKSSHHPTQAGTQELFTNPVVTWSPAPVNGRFAPDTDYTATITYTPLRQGYGLTAADASKITVAGAERVTVNANGAIQAVFPAIRETPGLHGAVSISVGDDSTQQYSGTAYVVSNITITVHVKPDPGYQLSKIQVVRADNGQQVPLSGSGNTYTFKMPAVDVSIQAFFAKN